MSNSSLELDPEKLIQEAINSNLDSSVFEIDDHDLIVAPNVIRWCLGAEFANGTLFTKQAEVLVQLFADYCFACSDQAYLKNVPVEDTSGMSEFQDRVTLLEHGICPKCHKNRAELFEQLPQELVAVWGQRSGKCVLGSTLVETDQGTLTIEELFDGTEPEDTFVPITIGVSTGFGPGATDNRLTKWHDRTITITTQSGYTLTGSTVHPVFTSTGYKAMGLLATGDIVVFNKGQHVWPTALAKLGELTVDTALATVLGYMLDTPHRSDVYNVPYASAFMTSFEQCFPDHRTVVSQNAVSFILPKQLVKSFSRPQVLAAILRSPKLVVQAFVDALLGEQQHIDSHYQQIAFQIQQLLLKLDVFSTLKRHNNRVWRVTPVEGHDFQDPIVEKTEKLQRTKLYDLSVPGPHSYVANGIVVHNSVVAASKIATYQLHRILKITNVAKYFQQDVSQQFDFVFTALTSAQAQSTLWSKFFSAYTSAPWFKQYNAFLTQKAHELGIPPLFKVMDTYVFYGGTKNIYATSKPSDLRTLRGDTRLYASVDEYGWFDAKEDAVRANATEVYASLKNSLRTIRSVALNKWRKGDFNCPTALMINISSPSSAYDPIMNLLRDGERDPTKICSHLPTWMINPQIRKEDLANEFILKPAETARDFAAEPPLASDPFVGSEKILERIIDDAAKPLFRYGISRLGDVSKTITGGYICAKLVDTSILQEKAVPRLIAVDAGETGNSFAIGMYSLSPGKDSEPLIHVDGIIEVMPEITGTNEAVPVHFPSMFDVIMKLTDHFNVKMVAWDRWNSTSEIQRIRDRKIKAEKYSPRYEDFLNLRTAIYNGRLKAPTPETMDFKSFDISNKALVQSKPWTHFYVQIATVRGVGRRVLKPTGGEDDMFRTLVLASSYLLDPDVSKEFLHVGASGHRKTSTRVLGVVGGISGFSGSGVGNGRMVVKTRSGK